MVLIATIADLHNPRGRIMKFNLKTDQSKLHLFRTVTLTKNSHWGLVESLLEYAALSGGNMLAHIIHTDFKNDRLGGFKLDLE